MAWSLRSEREVEDLVPGTRHQETATVFQDSSLVPSTLYRGLYEAMGRLGPLRDALRVFRFSF
jgi:hypothetical protein